MTAWVLWSWDDQKKTWREARGGSQERMEQLRDERTAQAHDFGIAVSFVALPTGEKPKTTPGGLPFEPEPEPAAAANPASEPLTHYWHCWRFPDHHACAVALIERQSDEYDHLLGRYAELERAARQPA